MAEIYKATFQLRRGSAEVWKTNNPILKRGEPGFVIDENKLKIGDGVTPWNDLKYIGNSDNVNLSADGNSIILSDNIFKLAGFDAAEIGAQPRKKSDGTLEWVVPSSETLDGLQATVAGLQTNVTGLSEYVSEKPGEKCEGETFSIPTGETDADGNAIYEQKTAGIGTERFNVYENASFEWNGVTRTFTPSKPIGRFISARGTGNISRGLLEDVCGADNKTGENDIGTRQSGCANYAESYFGSQDGCGGTLTGKYGRTSGVYNRARGYACEARGRNTIADGSHGNTAGRPQETFGQFNIPDGTQKYIAIAGNGTDNEHRSNAYMLDYDGNAYFSGNVKIGGTPSDDSDAATKAYVDAHSGSSKQDDWNQNDTTAADYIKNRPGAYMGDETIYVGTPITALASGSYRVILSPAFTLTAGNAYRVTFNGTAYVLTAQDKTAEVNAIILGELTSDNKPDFTNYPFCVGTDLKEQLTALFTETAGKYKLKVESLGTVVVPLDSKFMPAGYATEAFVTNAIAGYATEAFVTNAINAALYVDSETEVG